MREAFGVITRHLGDGKFEIKPLSGSGVVIAQVLPVPDKPDYYGQVFPAKVINELAPDLIGREVVADLRDDTDKELLGFGVTGKITKSHENGGMLIVEGGEVEKIERRLGP